MRRGGRPGDVGEDVGEVVVDADDQDLIGAEHGAQRPQGPELVTVDRVAAAAAAAGRGHPSIPPIELYTVWMHSRLSPRVSGGRPLPRRGPHFASGWSVAGSMGQVRAGITSRRVVGGRRVGLGAAL